MSGRTLRWFCQPWSEKEREINQLVFYQVSRAYLPLCVKVHIYSIRSFVSLFNGREIFCVVMMTLGGGRAIITLWAVDRDRSSCCDCQKSWEVIVGSDLPSLHSCPFTLQVAERGSWQAIVITYKTCLLQSMIRTNIPG